MLRLIVWPLFGVFLLSAVARGNAGDTRESFSGTWHEGTDGIQQLTFAAAGDSIHVKEEREGKVRIDYTCVPDGRDCEFREDGHKGKVSLWFNVPYLVELRTQGETITKRRFLIKEDHATLQVEVMPMTPPGKTEVVLYSLEK